MSINLRKLKEKKSILLLLVAFALLTPIVIISFSSTSFDSRSSAGNQELDPKFNKANLNSADKRIDLRDFEVWLGHFNKVKRQNSYYVASADLNGNRKVDLPDFQVWLSLFLEYARWSSYKPVSITELAARKYIFTVSVNEAVVPTIVSKPDVTTLKGGDLVYKVQDESVVHVQNNGDSPRKFIIGRRAGNTTITVSSRSNPDKKMTFYVHVVNRRAVPLTIGGSNGSTDVFGYGVASWKASNANIALSSPYGGHHVVVTGKSRGVALLEGFSASGTKVATLYVGVGLLTTPTYETVPSTLYSGNMLRNASAAGDVKNTNEVYTKDQKDFLEDYLTQKVESVGGYNSRGGKNYTTITGSKQGSRAGAVAAARFLALEFPYYIPVASIDFQKKATSLAGKSVGFDFGNWINYPAFIDSFEIKDLYGYKLNIHDKNCWGCPTGLSNYVGKYGSFDNYPANVQYYGLHDASFVTWALNNGGLNIYYGMRTANNKVAFEPDGYLVHTLPGAEYINLFTKNASGAFVSQSVTEEQWKKVMIGDLVYRYGHVGMIIGLNHAKGDMYVAHQTSKGIIVDVIRYREVNGFKNGANPLWEKIILMRGVYGSNGFYISSLW